jgi:hypothetical protein
VVISLKPDARRQRKSSEVVVVVVRMFEPCVVGAKRRRQNERDETENEAFWGLGVKQF